MKRKMITILFAGVLVFACLSSSVVAGPTLIVPSPIVYGPIPSVTPGDPSHDYTFYTPVFDLADYGYVQEEFFIEGTANYYRMTSEPIGDIISSGHPYKTRIVVRRPISPKKFNGIVILEWQNVTAGYDIDAHWGPSWQHFVRHGYAWVGVSAQRVGVQGSQYALTEWSPTRYGTLDVTAGGTVPSDALCYDIYSQAAQAVRNPEGIDPMGGLKVDLVIAAGASQSAGRLTYYHNIIHPQHEVVDGFFLLVGGASGLRTDLNVKVMSYGSETDVRVANSAAADSDVYRRWEVTGTGHSSYVSAIYGQPVQLRDFGGSTSGYNCVKPPFSRVHGYYVINAIYEQLVKWIKFNIPPPIAPRIAFEDMTTIARDEFGIAKGGIRLPDVSVPIATDTGKNLPADPGSYFCGLFGSHEPFDDETLLALYRNHGAYVSAVTQAAMDNLKDGYILTEAAQEIRTEAAKSSIP